MVYKMKTFVVMLLKRLASMLVTRYVVIGALKIIVSKTKYEWDDVVIELTDNLLKDDLEGVQKNALKLLDIVSEEIKDKVENKKEEK